MSAAWPSTRARGRPMDARAPRGGHANGAPGRCRSGARLLRTGVREAAASAGSPQGREPLSGGSEPDSLRGTTVAAGLSEGTR